MILAQRTTVLSEALAAAARGWRVFPAYGVRGSRCRCGDEDCASPGKHPMTPHGCNDGTTDLDIIHRWFADHDGLNLGSATGPASGYFVLDIDPRHGGDESLADLVTDHGLLPATPTVVTGGGGLHLLFRYPADRCVPSRRGLRPGIDSRGDGGLHILPESQHSSGRAYAWELSAHPDDLPLAEAPSWLLDLVSSPGDESGHRASLDTAAAIAGVPEGQRNETVFRLACKLRGADVPYDMATTLVLTAARNCAPPYPDAEACDALDRAFSRYAPTVHRNGHSSDLAPPISLQTSPPTGDLAVGGDGTPPPPPSRRRFTGAELAAAGTTRTTLPSLPFLGKDGYMVLGWSHLIAGYPRSGKTELMLRLIRAWLDAGLSVLYLSEEPQSIWEARLGSLPGDWAALAVYLALGEEPAVLRDALLTAPEPIVVIDTFRNLLGLRDETDNSEIARAINPWIAAARQAGKTLIVLHHNRKGAGDHGEAIAGGHALLGTFDIALELIRVPQHDRQRLIRGHSRVIETPELIYEQDDDGTFVVLGNPGAVALEDVQDRISDVLAEDWLKTAAVQAALGEPQPSLEQVRLALLALAKAGTIEREPPIEAASVKGKTVRWRAREPGSTSPPT